MAKSASEGTPTQTSSYSGEDHRNAENVARALVNICETLQRWKFYVMQKRDQESFSDWRCNEARARPLFLFVNILPDSFSGQLFTHMDCS